jgi:succinoglycan biosynthesis protein ExoV
MKLYISRDIVPNFGDELNDWLMPRLFGSEFFDDEPPLFLPIGSILDARYPADVQKVVFGSGYGAYYEAPKLNDTWRIYCVRGPQTAEILGLDASLAVCDPAILLREFRPAVSAKKYACSFMPHYESIRRGQWQQACAMAGIHFIDPRLPVEAVMDELEASEKLLTEAMHGAIVADALRVPWVAMQPVDKAHHMKWHDWARSLDIDLRFQRFLGSSLRELRFRTSGLDREPLRGGLKGAAAGAADRIALELAASALAQAAAGPAQLSDDIILSDRAQRLLQIVARISKDYAQPSKSAALT